jgi:hypothetical protein
MPTTAQIVDGLARIADEAFVGAVAWHLAIAAALVAVLVGWRPSRRAAGVLLALPLLSAAVFALAFGNLFNTAALGALAVALVAIAARLDAGPVRSASGWPLVLGAAMLLFGIVYPHFLADRPALAYVYGAPVGLVPCPTLSLSIGFALIAGGLGSRAWSLTLAIAGLFYGAFGALRLGVTIDAVLVVGAAGLIAVAARSPERRSRQLAPER